MATASLVLNNVLFCDCQVRKYCCKAP